MRVRKVDSDAIKLYESSQVKFKTTGTIREVQFSAGVNKSCSIQNISKDTYLDKATGEIKARKHNKMSDSQWEYAYRCFELMNLDILAHLFSADGVLKRGS